MLTEYGDMCKKVDTDIAAESEAQYAAMEDRLAKRRANRKKDIEAKSEDLQKQLNSNAVNGRSNVQGQLD